MESRLRSSRVLPGACGKKLPHSEQSEEFASSRGWGRGEAEPPALSGGSLRSTAATLHSLAHFSNAKIFFQSVFMLTTVQPRSGA
jgi:hypothetical protein